MTGILVLVIVFALGCITGIVIHLLARRRLGYDAPRPPQSRVLPTYDPNRSASASVPLTPRWWRARCPASSRCRVSARLAWSRSGRKCYRGGRTRRRT